MQKLELPFGVRATWFRKLLTVIIIGWMTAYPIYASYYKAYGVDTYERFLDHLEGRSMFFNPWQYRVLCPTLIESVYQALDHTLYKVIEIRGINVSLEGRAVDKNPVTQKLLILLQDPVFIKYTIVFLGFRFLEGVLILLLLYNYFSFFISNNGLKWLGLILITLFMGNGVVDSDLTFNTYMDVILYLWAGIVIMKNLNPWWILLITIIGALNRETSVFIPVLYLFSKAEWKARPDIIKVFLSDQRAILVTFLSGIFFVAIFVIIRIYYGYQPQASWRVPIGWPMLKLNLFSSTSVKTYNELFGVFAFFPLWALFVLKTTHHRLKVFFLTMVPLWFALHLYAGIAFQTRLFLVPTALVILPIVLEYIDRKSKTLLDTP